MPSWIPVALVVLAWAASLIMVLTRLSTNATRDKERQAEILNAISDLVKMVAGLREDSVANAQQHAATNDRLERAEKRLDKQEYTTDRLKSAYHGMAAVVMRSEPAFRPYDIDKA